jgi:hypothetical protein
MIFAHIAGLSETLKTQLSNSFLDSNYVFLDLDKLTDKITHDKNMKLLIQKYEYYCEKSKSQAVTKLQSKQFVTKSKDIERKMSIYWKNKMNFYILDTINSNSPTKKIILLGYCNFFKNIRIFIPIQTNTKIFYSIASDIDFIKDIVRSNLDNSRESIISGTYNLDLINPIILTKKREITAGIYGKNGYTLKSWDGIIKLLGLSLQNYSIPQVLYFASQTDYNKKIPLNKTIAYSDDWIAIISAFKTKALVKGYEDDNPDKPFVQEVEKAGLDILSSPVYLYAITNTSLFVPIITKNYIYKYETTRPVQICEKIQILNVGKKLKEIGVKLIGLKRK